MTGPARRAARHARLARALAISHCIDASIAMVLTTGIAFGELGNHAEIPLTSGSFLLDTQSIFDVFYAGVFISWALYIPTVAWIIGRTLRSSNIRISYRRRLSLAIPSAAKGLTISAVTLVLCDMAFEILTPSLAFSFVTSMIIMALASGAFQVIVSGLAAHKGGKVAIALSENFQ